MSATTSRKYAWFGKTDVARKMPQAMFDRVMADITDAESEEAFRTETKRKIEEGRREEHARAVMSR